MKSTQRIRLSILACGMLLLSFASARLVPLEAGRMLSADKGSSRVCTGTYSVDGRTVTTWQVSDAGGTIKQVGVSLPYALAEAPPAKRGTGPSGAVAVVPFSSEVVQQTYFNHFELHWNPHGHPPACFMVPHYDLHFYGIPISEVRAVKPPDTQVPSADRVPAGFVYPGVKLCVPQMGVHATMPMDMSPGHPFRCVMVAGFYGGTMNFIEPMITRACLLKKESFTLPVPQPKVLGRSTLYPHKFNASYDARTNQFDFVFSDFRKTAG